MTDLDGIRMGRACKRCGLGEPEAVFYESWPEVCAACRREHQKRYYAANRERYLSHASGYYQQHAVRVQATSAVNRAVREGVLAQQPCFTCGTEKAEAHHSSYARDMWLVVTWLCRSCHRQVHPEAA